MRRTPPKHLLALSAFVLALSGAVAWAGDDDFDFDLDPAVIGGYFTDIDTESAKFEEYRDLGSGFALPVLHLSGSDKDKERVFDFRAVNVRRRDARYTLEYDVPGSWSLLVDYNKIPHNFGNSAMMLWTETAPGVYELPDPMQQALQDAVEEQFAVDKTQINYTFLSGLIGPYIDAAGEGSVGLQRDRSKVRFDLGKMGRLAWALEYTHENREGYRPFGMSLGFGNADELPEPIHYDTTGVEIGGEWNSKRAGLRFGYRFSRFENGLAAVTWDNPWRATDSTDASAYASPGTSSVGGSARGRTSLPPDNDAGTLFLDGRAKLGDIGWIDGSLGYTLMEQDERLLPYTINTAIDPAVTPDTEAPFDASDPANLPQGSAGTEARVANAAMNVGFEVGERGEIQFRYRYHDYDNKSDHIEFPGYVRFDAVWEAIGRQTVPYGFNRQDLGLEFSWELGKSNTLGLSFNRQSWDRDFREISESDENVAELFFDSRASDWMTLRASIKRGDRSIGHYSTEAQEHNFTEPEGINNQPGLRKLDEAARTFDLFNISAQFTPGDGDFVIYIGATSRSDDYDESEFGIISDEIMRYVAEFSYNPSDKIGFFVFGERDDRENFQRARTSGSTLSENPQDNWQVMFDEVTDTWGLGLNSKLADRCRLNLGASISRSDGDADFYSPPGGTPDLAFDFGNYDDVDLLSAWVKLDFEITDHASAGIGYLYEDYSFDSFRTTGLLDYEPGTLLLNPEYGDYKASVVTAKMKFQF